MLLTRPIFFVISDSVSGPRSAQQIVRIFAGYVQRIVNRIVALFLCLSLKLCFMASYFTIY